VPGNQHSYRDHLVGEPVRLDSRPETPAHQRANAIMSIFVAGLLRVCLGLGFFTQRVTLAIPTQKRAVACAMVNPSFLRTDKTLQRNDDG
jgi:hypothetical protein